MGANLDGAAVLFFRDAVHYWIRSGIRIAGGRAGTGQIWIDHLQIHGAHPAVRSGVDLYPGDHHYTDPRHSDLDRTGASDVSALRELHLDRLAHGAPPVETDCRPIACIIRITSFCSARSRLHSARRSARF